jgi:hypothetical protein
MLGADQRHERGDGGESIQSLTGGSRIARRRGWRFG